MRHLGKDMVFVSPNTHNPPLNHTGEAMTCFTSSQDQVHGVEETGWNNPSYYRIILLQEGGVEGTK